MHRDFYQGNRNRFYQSMEPGSMAVFFSGEEVRKTNDEFYPFFSDRNFVYLTGISCKEAALLALKDQDGGAREILYLLPPDPMTERWTGTRIKPDQAQEISGIEEIRYIDTFYQDFAGFASAGNYGKVYLDLYKEEVSDRARPGHSLSKHIREQIPYLEIGN